MSFIIYDARFSIRCITQSLEEERGGNEGRKEGLVTKAEHILDNKKEPRRAEPSLDSRTYYIKNASLRDASTTTLRTANDKIVKASGKCFILEVLLYIGGSKENKWDAMQIAYTRRRKTGKERENVLLNDV